ncbi:unnamed protein product [Aphanomyces euteiches]
MKASSKTQRVQLVVVDVRVVQGSAFKKINQINLGSQLVNFLLECRLHGQSILRVQMLNRFLIRILVAHRVVQQLPATSISVFRSMSTN